MACSCAPQGRFADGRNDLRVGSGSICDHVAREVRSSDRGLRDCKDGFVMCRGCVLRSIKNPWRHLGRRRGSRARMTQIGVKKNWRGMRREIEEEKVTREEKDWRKMRGKKGEQEEEREERVQ